MFITISSLARTVELGGARPAVIGEPVVDARVASAPVVPQAAVRRLDRCGGAEGGQCEKNECHSHRARVAV